MSTQNFRCYIAWCSAGCHCKLILHNSRESEVADFDYWSFFWFFIKQVFRLEITMNYIVKMAVANGINYRSDCVSSFLFRIVFFFDNSVKELASRHEFKHDVKMLLCFKHFKYIDYIRMVNLRLHRPTCLWCSTSLRREMWSSSPILSLWLALLTFQWFWQPFPLLCSFARLYAQSRRILY